MAATVALDQATAASEAATAISVEDDPYQVYMLRHPAERASSVVPQLPKQPEMADTRLRYRRIAPNARSGSIGSLGGHFPRRFQFPPRPSLLESLTSDDDDDDNPSSFSVRHSHARAAAPSAAHSSRRSSRRQRARRVAVSALAAAIPASPLAHFSSPASMSPASAVSHGRVTPCSRSRASSSSSLSMSWWDDDDDYNNNNSKRHNKVGAHDTACTTPLSTSPATTPPPLSPSAALPPRQTHPSSPASSSSLDGPGPAMACGLLLGRGGAHREEADDTGTGPSSRSNSKSSSTTDGAAAEHQDKPPRRGSRRSRVLRRRSSRRVRDSEGGNAASAAAGAPANSVPGRRRKERMAITDDNGGMYDDKGVGAGVDVDGGEDDSTLLMAMGRCGREKELSVSFAHRPFEDGENRRHITAIQKLWVVLAMARAPFARLVGRYRR